MGSGGGSWDTNDVLNAARLNQKTVFISVTEPDTKYSGQLWYDTAIDKLKARNSINTDWSTVGVGTGVSDHGSLTGLGDDDHTQYLLATGARALSGAISHAGFDITNIGRVTGVTFYVGTTDTYIQRSGATSIQTHNIVSITDSTYSLGTVGNEWKNIYVDNIYATGFAQNVSHVGWDVTNVGRLTGVTIYVGTTDTYLARLGAASMSALNFSPVTDSTYSLGTVGREWKNLYVDNLYAGAITANMSHSGYDITNVGRLTGVTIYVGTTDTYIQRSGATSIQTHNIIPITNLTYSIGTVGNEWKNMYASTIYLPEISGSTFPYLAADGSFSVEVHTAYGYISIGPINASAAHFYTDRALYYFDRNVQANGNMAPYTDLVGTSGSSANRWSTVHSNSYIIYPVPATIQASGIMATFQVGEGVNHATLLYMKSDGKYYKAQATSSTLVPAIAISIGSISADAIGTLLFSGFISNSGWAFSTSAIQYLSTTAGTLTATAPSAVGNQVQPLGVATASTILMFNPDLTVIEV